MLATDRHGLLRLRSVPIRGIRYWIRFAIWGANCRYRVVVRPRGPGCRCVKFAWSASEQLLLDLFYQTRSETEFYRAVELFRKLGVIGDEHVVLDEPGGQVVGRQLLFNVTFRSVDEATDTAQDIFSTVYGFPADCDLETCFRGTGAFLNAR